MKDITLKIYESCSKGEFTFDCDEILKSNNEDELWNAFEEVCARIAAFKATKKNVPEEWTKLKNEIRNKLK